jgi:hypothetical protein
MTSVRNILTAIGVYWLCSWLAFALAMILPNAHTYSDTPLTAVVFGIEMEMSSALVAAISGALVTLIATGKKPERWAFVIAVLAIIRRGSFSRMPLEQWYRIMKYTAILFPVVMCIASAYLVAYFRSKHSDG